MASEDAGDPVAFRKGDAVKVRETQLDMFNNERVEWLHGTVTSVRRADGDTDSDSAAPCSGSGWSTRERPGPSARAAGTTSPPSAPRRSTTGRSTPGPTRWATSSTSCGRTTSGGACTGGGSRGSTPSRSTWSTVSPPIVRACELLCTDAHDRKREDLTEDGREVGAHDRPEDTADRAGVGAQLGLAPPRPGRVTRPRRGRARRASQRGLLHGPVREKVLAAVRPVLPVRRGRGLPPHTGQARPGVRAGGVLARGDA
ncbi:hypothetical protein THAOC_01441, partial [Thalassiosira oceanica]